jgi:hypothetical protein
MDRDKKSEQLYSDAIPRAIEVLIKKASVDPEFRGLLMEKRADAAQEIDLELSQVEVKILSDIPREQLEKIIDNTKVPPEHRSVFLGNAGKLMLAAIIASAALGVIVFSLSKQVGTAGISPDRVRDMRMKSNIDPGDPNDVNDPDEFEQSQENQKK